MQKIFRWPTLIVLAVLLLAALVPTVISISHATHAHASGSATLTLSAPTGQPGATIAVSGQGFAASTSVSLYLGSASGTLLGTATTDGGGNLPSTNVTVPDQPGGAYGITAVQGTVSANAPFSIVPEISLPVPNAYPGETITLTAKGFVANTLVQVYLDNMNNEFASFTANTSGDASTQITLPGYWLTSGHHVVFAVDTSPRVPLMAQTILNIQPSLSPMAGQPGSKETLTGVGFAANEVVNVYWGKTTTQLLGTATAYADGYLSFSFTVPTGLSAGVYPVMVVRTKHFPLHVIAPLTIKPLLFTITPAGIRSGQPVQVQLAGFLANDTVTLNWNANGGERLTVFGTNQHGSAKGTFIPYNVGPGTYTVTASDSQGLQATSTLSIGPGISLGSGFTGGTPGQTIFIYGGGFAANETVNVYLQTPAFAEVTTSTGTTGTFYISLTLPNAYNQSARYFLYAVSSTGTDRATIPFKFVPPSLTTCNYFNTNCSSEQPYGLPVGFLGDNFGPDETVDIIWNYGQPGQITLAKVQCFFGDDFSLGKSVPSVPGQGAVTIAAIGESSHLIATTTLTIDPAIYDNTDRASAGTSINVNGGGYGAGDALVLTLAGQTVGTLNTQSDGTFTTSFKMPAISGAGNLTLTVTDTTTNNSLSLPIYYMPTLIVSPTVVQNGDTVTVTGKHFSSHAQIQLGFWGPPLYFLTDANGNFTGTFTVSGLQPGSYDVYVEDQTSIIVLSVPIVVQ